MIKPVAMFKITGEVGDFKQIDNLYNALKREGIKLMKGWTIEIDVSYSETKEEG